MHSLHVIRSLYRSDASWGLMRYAAPAPEQVPPTCLRQHPLLRDIPAPRFVWSSVPCVLNEDWSFVGMWRHIRSEPFRLSYLRRFGFCEHLAWAQTQQTWEEEEEEEDEEDEERAT